MPNVQYEKIGDQAHNDRNPSDSDSAKVTGKKLFLSLLLFISLLGAGTYVLKSRYLLPEPPQRQRAMWTDCGSSPNEARGRGCKFDILSFAWQTPDCYDEELLEEFVRNEGQLLRFFRDEEGTDEVPYETARLGNETLLVTQQYHTVHCTYLWRQLHRAYAVRKHIDSHLSDYNHTLHCQDVLRERDGPFDAVTTIAFLLYPTCITI